MPIPAYGQFCVINHMHGIEAAIEVSVRKYSCPRNLRVKLYLP